MISFCGFVEGFRDPQVVSSLSYDIYTREFETLLKESRQHVQSMTRLAPVLVKGKSILGHAPISSLDRRFLAYRKQSQRIGATVAWIGAQTQCRDFDKRVLPFAFAFARERARESSRLSKGSQESSFGRDDTHVNARLAKFMARDWLLETGKLSKNAHEGYVLKELVNVYQWIDIFGEKTRVRDEAYWRAWCSAALAPILEWEENMNVERNKDRQTADDESVVCQSAPDFSSVPNDAIWSLAIHPGGVEAWLRSLVNIGYVPVQAPISSSGSTSTSVLDAANKIETDAVPAPLSISHAILSSTLSQLPAFLSHTNQRTLSITRYGARASKEAAALKAAAYASLREEQKSLGTIREDMDEGEEQDDEMVEKNATASVLRDDLHQYSSHWKQMRNQVPSNLASLFNQALATPFLSTSSSAAKKRKRWLQDAAAQDQIQTSTFHSMHVAHLEDTPLNYSFVDLGASVNRKLKPLPRCFEKKHARHVEAAASLADQEGYAYTSLHPMFSMSFDQQTSPVEPKYQEQPVPVAEARVVQGMSNQIIHELSMELNQRGQLYQGATSCCYLTSHDTCDICHIPMEQASEQPIQVCPICYSTRMTLSQYGKADENSPFSKYVRKAHFRTYMQQVQYYEQAKIDIEDIVRVANFLASRGFNSTNGTVGDVRWALLELKMNKCYNHVTQIYCRVFNKPRPRFTPDQQDILFSMFDAIQDPYFSAPNKGRSNFLSYQFVIYKSCELYGWNKFLPYFKMLKGDYNIITHDIIWKYICEQRNWQFIRTLSIYYYPPYFTLEYKDPLLHKTAVYGERPSQSVQSTRRAKPGDARSGDARSGDARQGDARQVDARPGDAKPGDARQGDARLD